MSIQIAGGRKEDGIVIGNAFDKYGSRNPIVKWMMNGFHSALSDLVTKARPKTIHEIGCGEGYWVCKWSQAGYAARGSDFSSQVIELARRNANSDGLSPSLFQTGSIYDLQSPQDSADLLVCCEVFEHLEDPRAGLEALQRVVCGHLILSVPREPIWRVLNVARGRYLRDFGNTPGHVQHWSKNRFRDLVGDYFEILETKSPFPWTMSLCRPRG
jgi:2-polyprenyl-3-methyl-5-hydroxy-6-metoxy-1,4-benzoquinol methylase